MSSIWKPVWLLPPLREKLNPGIQRPDVVGDHEDVDLAVVIGDGPDRGVVEVGIGAQDARRLLEQVARSKRRRV